MKRFASVLVGLLLVVPGIAEAQSKLLIREVVLGPTVAELVSITNTGTTAVDLTNYYLSDDATAYYSVTGTPTAPTSSDFVVRFPAGATIAAGATQYVSIGGAVCFETACGTTGAFAGYGVLPTYEISSSTAANHSASVPDMLSPFTGAIGSTRGLTNGGEPIILFYWDGASALVTDVDYVYAGASSSPAVNKTGIATYLTETTDSTARHAPLGTTPIAGTCRVASLTEGAMTLTGGNGVGGRDETSEDWSMTFVACTTVSIGPVVMVDGGVPMGDAGPIAVDAGVDGGPIAVDAGIDGGPVEVDAGTGVDSGTLDIDAGTDSGTLDIDAAIDVDAAIDLDAGESDDAGPDVDASGSDAGPRVDGGRGDAGTVRPPPGTSGCSCRVGGGGPSSAGGLTLAALALAAIVIRRRR